MSQGERPTTRRSGSRNSHGFYVNGRGGSRAVLGETQEIDEEEGEHSSRPLTVSDTIFNPKLDEEFEDDTSISVATPNTESTATESNNSSSSYRMEDGQPLPKILPGPYFPRSGTVLTDAPSIGEFLRIRPPMYSPPPEKEPTPEDNLYEDPDKNEQPYRRQSKRRSSMVPSMPDSDLPSSAPPYTSHAYEHPISQEMRRQQQLSYANSSAVPSSSKETTLISPDKSDDEARALLRKNDEGRYYIASSSAHTTMSSVSPASNRYEHSCLTRGPLVRMLPHHHYSGHESSMYDPSAPLHPSSHAGQPPSSSTKRKKPGIRKGILETSANLFSKSSKKRKSSLTSEESRLKFYKYLCIFLFLLLLVTVLLLFGILIIRANSTKDYAFYDKACSIYSSAGNLSDDPLAYSLPTTFILGEFISGVLPPGQIVYTQFSIQRDGEVTFNVSVPTGARIVMYGRQTLEPTPAMNDFRHVIHADRLHLSGPMKRVKKSVDDQERTQIFRSALITYYLMSGRWHLGFLNDAYHPLPITLVASLTTKKEEKNTKLSVYGEEIKDDCKYNCFNKGTCRDGKCHCFPGYNGKYCEETACPVLCSGNGIFTNGRCACHEGFKGPDCDLVSSWCLVPSCNHHGRCLDGECRCDRGWKGEFCDVPDCADPSCSGHGICHMAKCYCRDGYHGETCEKSIHDVSVSCPIYEQKMELHKPQGWSVEQPKDTPKSPLKIDAKVEQKSPQDTPSQRQESNQEKTPQRPSYEGPDPACSGRGKFDKKSKKCICFDRYTGPTCEAEKCSPECVHGLCQNGGCLCQEGWQGRQCSELKCMPGCEVHGSCKNGTCLCQPGWYGENCFIEGCAKNCSGGGTCRQHFGEWKCFCDSMHYGDHCQLMVEEDCEDGVDNDGDGLTDCEDSECCSSRSCSSNPMCTSVTQPRMILSRLQPKPHASFYQRSKFLIDEDSVQRFANSALFDENRVSILRGQVISKKGGPLTGVRISDVSNPRYGFSLSRSDDGGGAFDLLVNGGGRLTLQFLRHPYGKVEKSFYVPPNEVMHVGEVVMDEEESKNEFFKPVKISEKCKSYKIYHNIEPTILPSWKFGQLSGRELMTIPDMDSQNSQILADSGIVNEKIPLGSTNKMSLVYSSDRSEGYNSTLHISLLGSHVPDALRLVHFEIDIAGRSFSKIFAAKPNLTYTFPWDQKNVYLQNIFGLVHAHVSIGYVYEGCTSDQEIIWHHETVQIEGKLARNRDFGSWTFDFHHYFDSMNMVLDRGDGKTLFLDQNPEILTTLIGSDERRELNCKSCTKEGVQGSKLFSPSALAAGPDGLMYIGDYDLIRRVSPDRKTIETILKLSTSDTSHTYYLSVDTPTGNLYVSMPLKRQIWQIQQLQNPSDTSTNYQVVAGDGSTCADASSTCGDGGSAEAAQLFFPKGVTFDADGNMIFVDGRRIRMVTKQRQIKTLVQDKEWKPVADGCSSSFGLEKLNLEWPTSIAYEPYSKTLIVLDTDVIYKIDFRAKIVKILAGMPKGCEQTSHGLEPLSGAKSITLDPKLGVLHVSESDDKRINQIRSISINGGPLILVAGKTGKCDCDKKNCPCDETLGEPVQVATNAMLHKPSALAVDLKGRLYVADQNNFKIKIVEPSKPEYDSKERLYKINSPEENEVYYFDQQGRHRRTVELMSGQTMYNFTYGTDSSSSFLTEIQGPSGFSLKINPVNDTTIVLEGSIPEKIHLRFTSSDRELLQTVTSDSLGKVQLEYTTGQLLSAKISNGHPIFYSYDDATGRVKNVTTSGGNLYGLDPDQDGQKLATRVALNEQRHRRYSSDLDIGEFSEEADTSKILTAYPNSFILSQSGLRVHYELTSHPLLLPYENMVMKRKIVAPSHEAPLRRELNSRFEWRAYVRRGQGKKITQVGRRARINGVNIFTIEFDRTILTDTIRDTYDNDLISFTYNPMGQIIKIIPSTAQNLPNLNVTYDSSGLPLTLEWLEKRRDFVYDQRHRLILSTFGRLGDMLKRRYSYGKDSSKNPSMVEVASGDKYKWLYGSYGGVTALKTPSDEIHHFWSIAGLRPEIYRVLYRQTPYLTSKKTSYVSAVDEHGHLTHFSTPDQMHYMKISRDTYGKMEKVEFDEDSIEYVYDDIGRVASIKSGSIIKEFTYQGPLIVAEKLKLMTSSKILAEFGYEYDDLFRLVAISVNFEGLGGALNERRGYNSSTGRINRMGNYGMAYEKDRKMIFGDKISLDLTYTKDQLIQKQSLTLSNAKILEMEAFYDSIGRLDKISWSIFGQKRPSETRTYTINGLLAQLNLGDDPNLRWTLHYDLDGRLKILNETKLTLLPGSVPQRFGEIDYGVDVNGWVCKRGDFYFTYDVFGQILKVFNRKSPNFDVMFEYDEKNRIVLRKYANGRTQIFFYGRPDKPELITHFMDSQNPTLIWSILYTDDDRPFMLENTAGQKYTLITDPLRSIRFVFNDQGLLSREIQYSPTGDVIRDSNPNLYIPLGYHGLFQDFEMGLIFVRAQEFDFWVSRPLDVKIGRFLSTSLGVLGPKIDVFQPEVVADPYGWDHGVKPVVLETDPKRWLKNIGINIDPMLGSNLDFSGSKMTGKKRNLMVSGVLNQFEQNLVMFGKLGTMTPAGFLPRNAIKPIRSMDSQLADFSRDEQDFGSLGVSIAITLKTTQFSHPDTNRTLYALLDGSELVNSDNFGIVPSNRPLNSSIFELHVISQKSDAREVTTTVSGFTPLTPDLNATLFHDRIELLAGSSKIVVHFMKISGVVWAELFQEKSREVENLLWKSEKDAIRKGLPTRNSWISEEVKELLKTGRVSGYGLRYQSVEKGSIMQNKALWKFEKVEKSG